jgi:hypothetical protein
MASPLDDVRAAALRKGASAGGGGDHGYEDREYEGMRTAKASADGRADGQPDENAGQDDRGS